VIANGQLYETRKTQAGKDTVEGLARVDAKQGNVRDKELIAKSKADYLKQGNGGGVALSAQAVTSLDSSVGFSAPPPSAKLAQANDAVGVNSVAASRGRRKSSVLMARQVGRSFRRRRSVVIISISRAPMAISYP
jgi:hypothetical protein